METISLGNPSGEPEICGIDQNQPHSDSRCPGRNVIFQTLVVFSATLFQMSSVIGFGWPSPSIPKLLEEDSDILVSAFDCTLIVSFIKVGTLISILPVAWMMDRLGRKRTLLMGSAPMFLSFLMVAVGKSVYVLYAFTLVCGFGFGISSMVIPMYIAEISSDNIRGYLGVLYTFMGKLGLVYMFSIGPYVSIQEAGFLGSIPVILFIATFAWMPESPYHLLASGQKDRARSSLVQLRGTQSVDEELKRMVVSVEKSSESSSSIRYLLAAKGVRRSLLIVVGLSAFYEMCGSQLVNFYSQTIFAQIKCEWNTNLVTITLGLTQLFAAIVASSLVDSVGRRPLLLVSIIIAIVGNIITGGYFTLLRLEFEVQHFAWMPVTAIMTFMMAYTAGIKSLLSVLTAELFPKHMKAAAGAVSLIFNACFGFGTVFWYQTVTEMFGLDYLFYGFALCSLLFVPFIWFLVPETKGKPLDVILEEMENRKW